MKRSIIAALAIVAMAGCTKDSGYEPEVENFGAAKFTSANIDTRLSDDGTKWSATESIGISMFNIDEDDSSETIAKNSDNIEYVSTNTEEAASVTFEVAADAAPLLYPAIGSVRFYAYYPYRSGVSDNIYSADVSDQSENVDFMTASTAATDKKTTSEALLFSHKLSLLTINITAKEDISSLEGLTVEIEGVSTTAEYDIRTAELASAMGGDDVAVELITSAKSNSATATAILLPETFTKDVELTLTLGTKSYTTRIAKGTEFIQGKQHAYDVALGYDIVDYLSGSQISDWGTTDDSTLTPNESIYDIVYNSSEEHYEIYTAKGLIAFAEWASRKDETSVDVSYPKNDGHTYGNTFTVYKTDAKLMNDINLVRYYGEGIGEGGADVSWTPIDNYDGSFDGGNHTISGLYISDACGKKTKGLFGSWGYNNSGLTIQNLRLESVTITSELTSSNSYIGCLVGCINKENATISNCHIDSGSVSITYSSGNNPGVGGMVGFARQSLSLINCSNNADITYDGSSGYIGGIVGYNGVECDQLQIINCFNSGDIEGDKSTSNTTNDIGGILGYFGYESSRNNSGTITNCYSSGEIYNLSTITIGGIVGLSGADNAPTALTLTSCYCNEAYSVIGSYSSGRYTIVGSSPMSSSDMKSDLLVTYLNNGVYTYNNDGAPEVKAYAWEATSGGYPTFDPDGEAQFTVYDSDITYNSGVYEIYTAKGLRVFADLVNNAGNTTGFIPSSEELAYFDFSGTTDNTAINGKLMEAIDLEGDKDNQWTPIGCYDYTYAGKFDGDGKSISGLYIDNDQIIYRQGLFGYVIDATIEGVTVESPFVSAYQYVGGVVGYLCKSTISNCHVVGDDGSVTGDDYVGGVVGHIEGSPSSSVNIVNCSNSASVTGSRAGGILGSYSNATMNYTIANCYNSGSIYGRDHDDSKVGGIAGSLAISSSVYSNYTHLLTNCYNSGAINSDGVTDDQYCGSIVGSVLGTVDDVVPVSFCYWDSDVNTSYGFMSSGSMAVSLNGSLSGMSSDEMKGDLLVTLLNNGAYTYNNDGSPAIDAYGWMAVSGGYPVFDTVNAPTYTDPDIVYNEGVYEIYSAKGLRAFADLVNGAGNNSSEALTSGDAAYFDFTKNNISINGQLMAAIDLEGDADNPWTPIGTSSISDKQYAGTFDGGGFTISGLYIDTDPQYQGLFGAARGATIENVTLSDISVETSNDGASVGGLVGYLYGGTISNCHTIGGGSVTGGSNGGYIGGLVGMTDSNSTTTIINCSNSAGVTSHYMAGGGIVAYASGTITITNCYNSGAMTGYQSKGYLGGIAGYCEISANLTITNCYSSGALSEGRYMGGIIGSCYNNTAADINLNYCYFVESSDYDLVGYGTAGINYTATNSEEMTAANMQLDTLVKMLNNGAYTYNQPLPTIKAYGWAAVANDYPKLDATVTPTLTVDDDIVYNSGVYEIKTAKGLRAFSDLVNGAGNSTGFISDPDAAAYFDFTQKNISIDGELMAAIDLEGDADNQWSPIGTGSSSDKQYAGTFDGGGFTISGLYIDTDQGYQGLFGAARGATIENVTLSDISVETSSFGAVVGGLVGYLYGGTISNCHTIDGGSVTSGGGGIIGGLVGMTSSTTNIINCSNSASVTYNGADKGPVGGIVAFAGGTITITNCYNSGAVTGYEIYGYLGGIVGHCDFSTNLTITNCYSSGALSDGGYKGGIIGHCSNATTAANINLNNCYFVESSDYDLVGEDSIAGENYTATDCEEMTAANMQLPAFVTKLNNAAYTYNQTPPTIKAYGWAAVANDYPTFDKVNPPTYTDPN